MKIAFLHIVDPIQFDSELAQLAALVADRGSEPVLISADYGTSPESVLGRLDDGVDAVLMRVSRQTLEIVGHFAFALRQARPQLPIAFFGPLAVADPGMCAGILDGGVVLTGESEGALESYLDTFDSEFVASRVPHGCWVRREGEVERGEPLAPRAADDFPNPNFGVFGGGSLFNCAIGCSFFGELGRFPIELATSSSAGEPANAALQAFYRRIPGPVRQRSAAQIADRLHHMRRDFENVVGLEVRDRGLVGDGEDLREISATLDRDFSELHLSLRLDVGGPGLDFIERDFLARPDRIVLECDRVRHDACDGVPGLGDADAFHHALDRCERLGSRVGLLVNVGLPGETAADLEDKIALVRSRGVEAVRFLPFEPNFAHPIYDYCSAHQLHPTGEESWNREVYRPLAQDCLKIEEWHLAWQACLDLTAELQIDIESRQAARSR